MTFAAAGPHLDDGDVAVAACGHAVQVPGEVFEGSCGEPGRTNASSPYGTDAVSLFVLM